MKVFMITIESPEDITSKDLQDFIWMNVKDIKMTIVEITGVKSE
jgi:hypothetical protein